MFALTRTLPFERLFAELMIMMGDEAYTASFASRFDLAGANMRSFEGALFEPNGINLSGGAGFEMLDLLRPIYRNTAAYGHFGREEPDFTWERTDKAEALRDSAGL